MDLRSGAAFWPIRNGLLDTYPPLDRDETADVAVIGAGVTGALVAYRLVEAGARVIVLDKRDVATGSTAASTGFLLYETDTTLVELTRAVGEDAAVRAWELGREAVSSIERLCRTIALDSGFERRDALYLASSRSDGRRLAGEHDLRARRGFDVEWLSRPDLQQRYGIDADGAILSRGSGQIDAHRFTHRILRDASRRGARIYDRSEVTGVTVHPDGLTLSTSRGPRVDVHRMVWAAGYEAVEETQKKVGRLHSTWAVVSEPVANLDPWRDRVLIWETARPYLYARVTEDGRVMVGGEDEPFRTRHTSERLLHKKARRLTEGFARLFPTIEIEPAYRWAGVFSSTKDGLPYIGRAPEHPHAWLALGYGGNGITFSMIAADIIHDAWRGVPNAAVRLFAFDR